MELNKKTEVLLKQQTAQDCSAIQDTVNKDECNYEFALKNKDASLCSNLSNAILKKVCPISSQLGSEQLILKLEQAKFNAKQGDVMEIKGKLTNATKKTVYLNGVLEGKLDNNFAYDFNPFFILASKIEPGESVQGLLLNFAIGMLAPLQDFFSSITIYGGVDQYAQEPIAIDDFEVSVK